MSMTHDAHLQPAERSTVTVRITRTDEAFADVPLPAYATAHAAGADIRAALVDPLELMPGDIVAVPTALAIALPENYEAQIRPRSGLALRGITLPNTPGTIDADYRGEIKVIMANIGTTPVRIERGDRIAQIVIAPVSHVRWLEVPALDDTARGAGGFGSTGVQ